MKTNFTNKSFNDHFFDDDRTARNFKESKKMCKAEMKRRKEVRYSKRWQEPTNY